MQDTHPETEDFDIVIVAQAGRLTYEAVLFAASLRAAAPAFRGELIVGEPLPGPLWSRDPRIQDAAARDLLETRLGARIVPFEARHFGDAYPNGNKVELLAALPPDRPFVFFDTDTLIKGPIDRVPFDFDRPAASMARENTWPKPPLYGPGFEAIWRAVYDRAGVALDPSMDPTQPDEYWEKYLYFNAGWFFARSAPEFAARMIGLMTSLRDDTPAELACQSLYPWLDQIALPPVITSFGGGRPGPELDGLDGAVTLHWRALPLLYATADEATLRDFQDIVAPNWIKKVLKSYDPFRRMVYHERGAKVRALFDRAHLPRREQMIRNRIKRENLWMR